MALERWLPYLDDEVVVHTEAGRVRGTVSRWDPAVALIERPPGALIPGQRVRARWHVGDVEHDGAATIEETTADAWTIRLDGADATPDFARRKDPRTVVSLPVTFSQAFSGSCGAPVLPARTLDISASGMRLDVDDGLVDVGDVLEVRCEVDGRVEVLVAYVVWESCGPSGHRTAGLRFRDEVRWEVLVSSDR